MKLKIGLSLLVLIMVTGILVSCGGMAGNMAYLQQSFDEGRRIVVVYNYNQNPGTEREASLKDSAVHVVGSVLQNAFGESSVLIVPEEDTPSAVNLYYLGDVPGGTKADLYAVVQTGIGSVPVSGQPGTSLPEAQLGIFFHEFNEKGKGAMINNMIYTVARKQLQSKTVSEEDYVDLLESAGQGTQDLLDMIKRKAAEAK